MKILLTSATGYPSPNTGGPNKIIYYILRSLNNRNITIDYISKHYQFYSSEIEQKAASANFINRLRDSLYIKNSVYRKFVSNPIYLQHHYRELEKFFATKTDSLQVYNRINSHDIISSYFLKGYRGRNILTIHSKGSYSNELKETIKANSFSKSLIKRIEMMEKWAFDEASCVTFPSIAAKNMFLEDLGRSESEKIKIIYNGIDIDEIQRINTSEDILINYGISLKYTHYIFNAASHIRSKNIDKIILTAELLIKKYRFDACVINAGTGPLTKDLIKMVYRLGLEKNFYFLGVIPNEDIIRFMKKCDFFLMTSEKVVFDMAILEALASGTVVLASRKGGNREIIRDGVNGYLLNENDPEEAALKIMKADRSVVKGALETAEKFSTKVMTEKYLELYEK